MANDPDLILLETVKTHRERMRSALVHGRIEERRTVTDNIRRFLGSVIVAALICGVCVGISFVVSVLEEQRLEKEQLEQEREAPPEEPTDIIIGIPSETSPTPAESTPAE